MRETSKSLSKLAADLLPVAVDKHVTGVSGAAGDWDVIPPVLQAIDSTALKLFKEICYIT